MAEDRALTEFVMSPLDATRQRDVTVVVVVAAVTVVATNTVWMWTSGWWSVAALVFAAPLVWTGRRAPYERTVVYADRLEVQRSKDVTVVIPRDTIESFRTKPDDEGGPVVAVVDVHGRRTMLEGTGHAVRKRWRDGVGAYLSDAHRRTIDALVTQFEHWRTHGRWE
ncbi:MULTISPECIES: hypothetical protein [Nocardiaceae]|uniref:Uncharacterized protein n=1 Tax=Rhodococcoides corynebacterioides TaxID=53972 RepID=A0ABS2KNQ9_9NOCA|nr:MULTISPECIES: hypothetical protein [Rhodococcus]MBM7413610.1 hypothetical protein [Rhodococcus corynebacterioides]MBP1116073.1 hypothetical protein [Rhodococcus sp. PvP016]